MDFLFRSSIQKSDRPEKLHQPGAEIEFPTFFSFVPWRHHVEIITKCHSVEEALFYIRSEASLSCPSDQRLKKKLESARYHVEHGLVDMDNVEQTTFGKGGFLNPKALLQWLYDNQPEEELVLSHGDFCLPNLFFHQNRVSGYIDLGKTGIADRWCDIALCYQS